MIVRLPLLVLAAFAALAAPAVAEEAEDAFVSANILAVFYHELGHALIDLAELPVFGQEEDAADVASILLIDTLFDDDTALDLAYDTAFGFLAEAAEEDLDGVPWWDVHGPSAQRFYNTVCLFYGADPDARLDFAEDMELPQDRAETCAEEYDLALQSWGPVLDALAQTPGYDMVFAGGGDSFIARVIADEVAALNADFDLPDRVAVHVEPCGEANAFYDPQDRSITICREFAPHLRQLFRATE